jgi:hypothetical protein
MCCHLLGSESQLYEYSYRNLRLDIEIIGKNRLANKNIVKHNKRCNFHGPFNLKNDDDALSFLNIMRVTNNEKS